ncbi:MAG: hypothetical protein ACE5GX_17715, partial [Thermoanaerobaculia bacterium]
PKPCRALRVRNPPLPGAPSGSSRAAAPGIVLLRGRSSRASATRHVMLGSELLDLFHQVSSLCPAGRGKGANVL